LILAPYNILGFATLCNYAHNMHFVQCLEPVGLEKIKKHRFKRAKIKNKSFVY